MPPLAVGALNVFNARDACPKSVFVAGTDIVLSLTVS